jgi:hypothetical protein
MLLYLLISLGACEALFVLGLFVYWIIINIKKTSQANQSNPNKAERQTPSTVTENIAGPSLEQPLNETGPAPVSPKETDNKTEDDDWLNAGVTEVSAHTIKQENDEWLNATVPEVSTDDYKQQDDDWLNAEINQPAETEDSPPSYQSLQDNITVKPVEEAVAESHWLIDDITVKPVQEAVNKSHALIDDITVKPVQEAVNKSHALIDDITVKPVEKTVNKSHGLTDEISLRPVENQFTETHVLMDEIAIKPSPGPVHIEYEILDDLITKSAIYRTKKAKPISNAVTTNPVEGTVEKIESSIDEITTNPVEGTVEKAESSSETVTTNPLESPVEKPESSNNAVTTNPVENPVGKAGLSSDAIIDNPVESPVEEPEPAKPVSVNEITEFLKEKRDLKQATNPSLAADSRSTPFLARDGEGRSKLLSQAKNLYKKALLPGAVTKALAALRIHNSNEFYIQDTNLTQADTSMQEPQIKGFTFKVLTTATELDELIHGGFDFVINFSKIKRGLKNGMVVFLALIDQELASMAWACITEESKVTLKEYPYNADLDKQACIVCDWANPKFRDSSISSYVKYKRQQLLKQKGFIFERSIAEENTVTEARSIKAQERFESTFKRRTYTNISFPGILGVEFRKERSLNEPDSKPLYQMITLLVLVLPSPPMVVE